MSNNRSLRSISTASGLTGVWPALFTPLKADDPKRLRNSIDYDKAKVIIDDLIAAGVTGLVPVGTTGQSPTVSPEQHLDMIRFTMDYVDGRVPVIAGAGSNSTRESVDMIQAIQKAFGPTAVLCVTGYYNNPPQAGLVAHFETLSAETGAKIVLYNVPARTGSYLEADTLIRLAADKNIIGLKQALDFRSEGAYRVDTANVIAATRDSDFAVVSGEDDGVAAMLELGGSGVISASANIPELAKIFLAVVAAHNSGDAARAAALQEDAMPYVKMVFSRKNPIPLGTLLNSPMFLPLVSVRETPGGEALHAELLKFMDEKAPSLKKHH
ncbi:MAG TPA: 4-hydroxy-tetrahydrodipicolinate synthase [Fibrobacteria bacterium]|jgi:4-hydroxy-tetrahydrodipicolinate synthase|nr:4-hydroxy-tetrahydrodipicolinate synthase [Fibrobacteria bacterium]